VCNVDDVIKTKLETVWYFAYWRARDVPSGAEVAIVVRQCEHCRTDAVWLISVIATQPLCG